MKDNHIMNEVQSILFDILNSPGKRIVIISKDETEATLIVEELRRELKELGMGEMINSVKVKPPKKNKNNIYKLKEKQHKKGKW